MKGRPMTWRAKMSQMICRCSSLLARSVTSGTSGKSACLLSAVWIRTAMRFCSSQCLCVATTLDQDQPQRPPTSPRSMARLISFPPG